MSSQARTESVQPGKHPSLLDMLSFLLRSKGLQAQHALRTTFSPRRQLQKGEPADFPYVLAESISSLDSGVDARERPLLLGKIQNLRLACRAIHRCVLTPTDAFSFWAQVGPPWGTHGFAIGREVREGCIIPTTGGGLCQLSGSLLEVASALDFELVERHPHTALPADVSYNSQRDATLFWNYVDLRFRSSQPVLLEASLSRSDLILRVRGKSVHQNGVRSMTRLALPINAKSSAKLESCHTCNQVACIRHQNVEKHEPQGKTAFLVDEYQPEYDAYIQEAKSSSDDLLMPFTGAPRHTWSTQGFARVQSSFWFRLQRSYRLRAAVARGVTVAKAHYEIAEALACRYERKLAYDAEHLCVVQTLLPHLWRAGVLGGRSFDVLMTRPPVALIEQKLDEAAALYPQSRTLTEFRAPRWFVEAEAEALQAARMIVTPHPQIAALFPNVKRLPWQTHPLVSTPNNKDRDLIVFFGPTLARKGALAVREAMRKTGIALTVLGSDLEEENFWQGLPLSRGTAQSLPWDRIHTVIQPSLFEFWPRQLLRAQSYGCNIVTSSFCGMEENPGSGMYHVPFGDADALITVIEKLSVRRRGVSCAT